MTRRQRGLAQRRTLHARAPGMPTHGSLRSLIASLIAEAAQAEDSAAAHAGREADRLGSAPPGLSMRSIAQHARRSAIELLPFARTRGEPTPTAAEGRLTRLLADMRELGLEMRLSSEKAYRGTLLGVHHAFVTFLLLEDAAVAAGDQELANYCTAWLIERRRLVADAERDLSWFAANPERAVRRALPPFVKRLRRAVPLPEALRERSGHAG